MNYKRRGHPFPFAGSFPINLDHSGGALAETGAEDMEGYKVAGLYICNQSCSPVTPEMSPENMHFQE